MMNGTIIRMSHGNGWHKKCALFEDQYGLCWLCHMPMHMEYNYPYFDDHYATFDHLIRKRDGGTRHSNNVLLAHMKCNNERK